MWENKPLQTLLLHLTTPPSRSVYFCMIIHGMQTRGILSQSTNVTNNETTGLPAGFVATEQNIRNCNDPMLVTD